MHPRFAQFPRHLAERSRAVRLAGDVPVLLAHSDWASPAPCVLWFHGRTASKELDPGRYLRWIRRGIAAVAIDLPGHGERDGPALHDARHTLEVVAKAVREIDDVIDALRAPEFAPFDTARLAIGGMSAGGMVALRRLCEAHEFRAAAVEATCGSLMDLYHGEGPPALDASAQPAEPDGGEWSSLAEVSPPHKHAPAAIAPFDPAQHLSGWRPIPLLAIHSEADRLVPFRAQRAFIDRLRAHYRALGADAGLVELLSWPSTGAPQEHLGFGRHSNDAKTAQTEFLARALLED